MNETLVLAGIITAIAIGYMTTTPIGWLVFAGFLVISWVTED